MNDKPCDKMLNKDLLKIIEEEFFSISSSEGSLLVIDLLKAEREALENWVISAYPSYTKDIVCDEIIELLDESIEKIITKRLED